MADESRGQPHDRAGIARSQENCAVGPGQEREDLSVVQLRDGCALGSPVADLVELPVRAGAHEQPVAGPAEREDQGLDTENLASHPIAIDAVDGIVAGRDGLGRSGAGGRGLGRSRFGIRRGRRCLDRHDPPHRRLA